MKNKKHTTMFIACMFLTLLAISLMAAPTKTVDAAQKSLKVGCSLPLNISFGVEIKRNYEILVDLINEAGGINVGNQNYKLEMIIYDDKYTAEAGRAAAERLIYKDKVKAIVGTTGGMPCIAMIPVAQEQKISCFIGAHTDQVVNPKWKGVYDTATKLSVDALYGLLMKAEPNAKTVVTAGLDDETGRYRTAKAVAAFKAGGLQVLDQLYFSRGTHEFTTLCTKVSSLNPDIYVIPGFGGGAEDQGVMSKNLYATGWRGVVMVTAQPVIKDLLTICSKEEAEGLYTPLADTTALPSPPSIAVKVKEEYTRRYGEWRDAGLYWLLPIHFFVAAAEKAGSLEVNAIDKAMAGLEIETVQGKARMIKRPDLNNPRYVDCMMAPNLGQLRNGKMEFAAGMTIDEAIKQLEIINGFEGQWK